MYELWEIIVQFIFGVALLWLASKWIIPRR